MLIEPPHALGPVSPMVLNVAILAKLACGLAVGRAGQLAAELSCVVLSPTGNLSRDEVLLRAACPRALGTGSCGQGVVLMRRVGLVGAAFAVSMALSAAWVASASEAKAKRPHLVVHPKHLKPGEAFGVQGSGFPAGEEVVIGECSDRVSSGFPLECGEGENGGLATVGSDGSFSVSMVADPCPEGETERPHPRRWCYVGVLGRSGEDTFFLKPYAIISVN